MTIQSLQQILEHSDVFVPDQVGSLIDGHPSAVLSDAKRLPVGYPATAEIVCHVVEDDGDTVDAAVQSARRAFDSGPWPRLSTPKRQAILRAAARQTLREGGSPDGRHHDRQ